MFVMGPQKPLLSGLIWVLCFCCLTTKACWVSFSRNPAALYLQRSKSIFLLLSALLQSLKKRSIGSCSMVKCLSHSIFSYSFFLRSTCVVYQWFFYIPNLFFILKLDLIMDYVECFCRCEILWFQQLLIECKIFAYHWKRCTNLFVFLYIFWK